MSRPSFRPTKDQRKLVRSLAAIGLRQEHIAQVVGVRSPKTLRKHFREEIGHGTAEAIATVTAAAYDMAVSGKVAVMTRFWLGTVGSAGMEPWGGPANDEREPDDSSDWDDAEE